MPTKSKLKKYIATLEEIDPIIEEEFYAKNINEAKKIILEDYPEYNLVDIYED